MHSRRDLMVSELEFIVSRLETMSADSETMSAGADLMDSDADLTVSGRGSRSGAPAPIDQCVARAMTQAEWPLSAALAGGWTASPTATTR